MKFIIERTSSWSEEKPCEEAEKMTVPYWHTRTCDEKEFNRKFSDREGLWRSKGKNHKITKDGYITRQEEDKEVWGIEIKSLEELLNFQKKYGSLILQEHFYDNDTFSLEIYDDYRE